MSRAVPMPRHRADSSSSARCASSTAGVGIASTSGGSTRSRHVVEAFEVPSPTRRRHLARVEEPLEHGLAVRPSPPRASLGAGIAQLRRRDRSALGDFGQHRLDVARALALHASDQPEGVGLRVFHPPAQQRMEPHGHERRHVAPVLEQLSPAFGEIRERRTRIRPEPGEQRKLVRADEHVDRVDLQDVDAAERPADVAEIDPPRRRRIGESLRRESDAAGRRVRDAVGRSAHASPYRAIGCAAGT